MTTPGDTLGSTREDRDPMTTPNIRFFAFVARFVDAVTTEALSTELTARKQARQQFEAAQRQAARTAETREAA